MIHLTDEEIQDYLDGNTPEQMTHVENHMKTCLRCQYLFNQYPALFTELKQEPQFQLPEQFADVIMKKLPFAHKTRLLSSLVKNILLGIGFLWFSFIVISIAYLINSKPWIEVRNQSTHLISDLQTIFFVSINRMLSDLIGKPYLLLFAGLTLLTITVIDHLIIQPKYKDLSF